MKSCGLILKPKGSSKLLSDLTKHYSGDQNKADIIYNDLLVSDNLGDASFGKYLDSKGVDYRGRIQYETYRNGEPTISEFIEWTKYLERYNKVNKKFATSSFQSTTKEFLELSEGFTIRLMQTIMDSDGKNFTPNDLFEKGNTSFNENNIMNVTLAKVKEDMRNNKSDIPEIEARKALLIDALNNHPIAFYSSYKSYLDNTFKIGINIESVLTSAIETNEQKETKDSAFSKNSNEFDQKEGAPNAIKILIASLPDIQPNGGVRANDLGLPAPVDYNNTFNFIQQKLVDLPSDVNLMINELKALSSVIPALNILAERLNFGGTYVPSTGKEYAKEQLLRTQFTNQFNKSQLEYTLHVKDKDGNIMLLNSNKDKLEDYILEQWQNNYQEIMNENPNAFRDILASRGKGKKEFLNSIGIELPVELNSDKVPNIILDTIADYGLEDTKKFAKLYSPEKNSGVKTQLKKLAGLAINQSAETVGFQHINAEGKAVYGITLNTYLSSLAKDLRYYAGTEEIAALYPEIFESDYNANSEWLRKILGGSRINIGVYDGIKSKVDKSSTSTKKLKAKDLNVQRMIGMMLEGKFAFLRSADRGTENYFYFEGEKSLIVDSKGEANTYFRNHLKDEMNAIRNKDIDIVHYQDNNHDFRAFHIVENNIKVSLLDKFNPKITGIRKKIANASAKTTKAKLTTELNKELAVAFKKLDNVDIDSNDIIADFLATMSEQIIEKEAIQLAKNGVLETHITKKGLEYKHIEDVVKKYGNVETTIDLFALNSFISSIEQTKVFAGDLAMFKSPADIFKRMSMLNSTKESARVDPEMTTFLNSLDHRFSERNVSNSEIKTITLNDVMSRSTDYAAEFDTLLRDTFGKDYKRYSEVYNDINEADGFAYMTYDEYRIASIRFGEWLPADESLYQGIADGNKNLIPEVMRRATTKKYQYTGKLVGPTSVNAIAVRKFAIMPLVPGAIPVGSVLEKLNQDMLDNNIGMAFYESAAKVGHSVYINEDGNVGAHSLYDADGNYHLDATQNYDTLDYKYMGNQLKINNASKDRGTASTQKRKLVVSNLYENGEVVDPDLADLLEEYDKIQSEIVDIEYEAMIEDELVESLIKQGLANGFTANELMSIGYLNELPIVDGLANKVKLESLIMSKLSNRVISNKRKGGAEAQVPDVGFEPNEDNAALADRHNLQFYREGKNGQLLPMEIMMALPTELIDYVKGKYGNGVLSQEALDAFNEDIAIANAKYEETGVSEELDKITTYVGYRIPNQAASSSDVAKVKKFLAPYLGNSIVVPKQIVAKTGSDFDIDKLNLYKPHFKVKYEGESKLAGKFATDFKITNAKMATVLENEFNIKVTSETNVKLDFLDMVLKAPEGTLTTDIGQTLREVFQNKYLNTAIPVGLEYKTQEIENRLLEVEIAITLHKANRKQLLAPLTDSLIKKTVKRIRRLRGEPEVKTDHISDVFTNAKNIEKFISFLSGQGGVGQIAIHITNHAVAQKAGLKQVAKHNYFGLGEGLIDLGLIENKAGQNISELLSEYLTANVDIAKDDYILDINAVQSTLNTILMMTRWGIDVDTVFLFMNQPIIKDYVQAQSLNESVVTDKTNGKLSKNKLIKSILKKWNRNPKLTDMISLVEFEIENGNTKLQSVGRIYNDITTEELEAGIQAKDKANPTTQQKMLDLFLEYQRQSKMFQKMISSTSPDTKGFKGISILDAQNKEELEVLESGVFVNYEKVFTKSFLGSYRAAKVKYFEQVRDLFLSQNPNHKEQLDKLKTFVDSKVSGKLEKERALQMIDAEFIRYILGRPPAVVDFSRVYNELMSGPTSVPKVIKQLKKYFKQVGIVNPMLEQMLPLINYDGKGTDNMKLKTKRLSTVQKETLHIGYKELKKHDAWIEETYGVADFSKALIEFQIVQTGIAQSPLSIMEALPADDYFNFTKNVMRIANNSDVNATAFTEYEGLPGEFLLHHPDLFFNKFNMPFDVQWSEEQNKFKVVFSQINMFKVGEKVERDNVFIWQQGAKSSFAEYGAYPKIAFAKKASLDSNPELRDIAEATNFYQMAPAKVTEIRPELEKTLKELLTSLGVDIKYVDNITDRNGNVINAYGKADLLNQVISLTKSRDISTLPEEAAHMITAMLGKNHPLMKQMMSQIHQFPIYQDVLADYSNEYQNEEDFRFEAVGKMIAEHLIKGTPIGNSKAKAFVENWFQRLIRKLTELFSGKNIAKLNNEVSIFEEVANKILQGDIKKDIANSSEQSVDRRLRILANRYNIDDNGVMPSIIDVESLEADLKKGKINNVTVKKTKNGYVFKKDGVTVNPIQEYFQLRETKPQSQLVRELNDVSSQLSPNKVYDEQGRERYQLGSEMLKNRVSDRQTEMFNKNKTKAEAEAMNNSDSSRIMRTAGTYMHEIAEVIMYDLIDKTEGLKQGPKAERLIPVAPSLNIKGKNVKVEVDVIDKVEINASVEWLAKDIARQQKEIDPDGEAVVIRENFVADKQRSTGGSQDVLVVYSDGSVAIYDYKFIKTKTEWETDPTQSIGHRKEESYSLQIGEYKRILRDVYGVTVFRNTRILPFSVTYAKKFNNITSKITSVEGFKPTGEKQYLMPIPVVNEMLPTDNPKTKEGNKLLNNILVTLFEREKQLVGEIKSNYNSPHIATKLQNEFSTLKSSIKSIQVNSDVSPLVETIENYIDHTTETLKGEKFDIENIGQLNKIRLEIKLFNSLFKEVAGLGELKGDFAKTATTLNRTEIRINEKIEEVLAEKYGEEIKEPQKELDVLSALFSNFSQINQPIFEAGRELVKKATGNSHREFNEFTDELETVFNKVKAWSKNSGVSIIDGYRKIINPKTGNLISRFSDEFNQRKADSHEIQDIKWFQENYKISDAGVQNYKDDLADFLDSLKGLPENSTIRDARLNTWKKNNDLSNSSHAWGNSFTLHKYAELKNEAKHYSTKYTSLPVPLKEYYDFYASWNKKFNDMVGESIGYNFVANVQKDLIDSIAQGDGIFASGKNAKKDFLNGLRVRQNDSQSMDGDTSKIPLLYYDNFSYYNKKTGKFENSLEKKNEDLTNNMVLFAEAVFRKKNMEEIQDVIEALKGYIEEQKVVKTNSMGKIITNEDGSFQTINSPKNADVFKGLTKGLVYGQKTQNKDRHYTVNGTDYSVNKTISTLMSYMSTKSLAFNYVSGFGNAMAGYINSYIKGVGGHYYTTKQMRKTHSLLMKRSDRDLYNHMAEFFNVERDHWVLSKAAKLSASKLTKALTFDKFYILQQKGDEFVANTILMSMLQNYGIDANGQVKRLPELPTGSKSLLELVDRTGDKIAIKGLSSEAFDDFRNKVKYVSRSIKGTNTAEDLSMVQTNVYMKAFMHFRNWIAPMVKERFGDVVYTKEVQEFEAGRYRSAAATIFNRDWVNNLKKLSLDIVTLGAIKFQGNVDVLNEQYDKFLDKNPDMRNKMTREEYLALRERTLREGLHEAKWVLGLLLLILAAKADFDDDGKPDYKQTKLGREMFKLTRRAYLELSFFSTPSSVQELLKKPLPVMAVFEDFFNVVGNTGDELSDIIFESEPDAKDKTGIGHYSKKMVPLVKVILDFTEDFNVE